MKTETQDPVLLGVAARVRALRRERGLTQAELAQGSGLSEGTISRLEKSHEPPTLNSLVRISRTLNVAVEKLVVGKPLPERKPPQARQRELRQLAELSARLDRPSLRQMLALARLLAGRKAAD